MRAGDRQRTVQNAKLVDAYQFANYYAGEGWCLDEYPEMDDLSISWWMPLPEPPTEQDHLRNTTKMMPRLIDADALMQLCKNEYSHAIQHRQYERSRGWQGAMQLLYDAPTIDPESLRPRERWEKATLNGYLCCSACKGVYIYEDWLADGKWSFCPNCGAKMDNEYEHV